MSPLLAVSALEKAQKLPSQFWLKVVVFFVAILAVVLLIKLASKVNKIVLGVIVVAAAAFFGLSWIYNRNEPAFMTPVIDAIAPFFPSKGSYETKQQEDPGKPNKPGAKPAPANPANQPAKPGTQPAKK